MNIDLKPETSKDQPFLYNLYASTRADEIAQFGWDTRQIEAFLRMQFDARELSYRTQFPDARRDIILVDGEPAGRMIVERAADHILVTDIAVLPEHRDKSVGTSLITALQNEAAGAHVPLILRVDKSNLGAVAFYVRRGFTVSRETDLLSEMQWG